MASKYLILLILFVLVFALFFHFFGKFGLPLTVIVVTVVGLMIQE